MYCVKTPFQQLSDMSVYTADTLQQTLQVRQLKQIAPNQVPFEVLAQVLLVVNYLFKSGFF